MGAFQPNWPNIVNNLGPRLYRYFCGVTDGVRAGDLVQETLLRLIRKIEDFDHSKGSIESYAFGLARFVRLEHQRSRHDFELVEDEASLDILDGPSNIDKSDPVAHLRWALRQLKPLEQELILRVIDTDAQLNELAREFEIPLGTIKSHIHRAKIKLREIMEAE